MTESEGARGADRIFRCPHCKAPMGGGALGWEDARPEATTRDVGAPGVGGAASCSACGAPVLVDHVAIDVLPDRAPAETIGARAMQSAWLARVYEACWRPVTFGLSTGFGAPGVVREARVVLEKIAGTGGPWLDLSCGTGTLTRQLLAHADGRAVFAVDLSRAMLVRAHASAPAAVLVRADAGALPFCDGVFGAIVNMAALDLYPDRARVLAESARVLAQGGRWVASTFVARRTRAPSALSALAGVRTPTLGELEEAATVAGLRGFGAMSFRGYVIAWADKP